MFENTLSINTMLLLFLSSVIFKVCNQTELMSKYLPVHAFPITYDGPNKLASNYFMQNFS